MALPPVKPLDIVRAKIPKPTNLGDPTKPGDLHPVLILRVIFEIDDTWVHCVFGTGQRTLDKVGGQPCDEYEMDVDAGAITRLTVQTRFSFKEHAPLKYSPEWFPEETLDKGRLPRDQTDTVRVLMAKYLPSVQKQLPPPSKYAAPPPARAVQVIVRKSRARLQSEDQSDKP